MRRVFHKKWITILVAAAWFSAAAVQDLAPAFSSLSALTSLDESSSAVESATIPVPDQGLATCHHHPEGCPANCHCAKTYLPAAEESSTEPPVDLLAGDIAWAECAESRALSTPAFAVYLAGVSFQAGVFENSGTLASPPAGRAREAFAQPPLKIPIA